jgi:phosphomannomutase
MTREEAEDLRVQLQEAYPEGNVEVTRVPGGVEVKAGHGTDWVFMRTSDDSPLLRLLARQHRATRM